MENIEIQNKTGTTASGSHNLNGSQPMIHRRNIFIIAVYCVIMFVSILRNSLILAVVHRNENKRMRTTTNYFIVNMSCSDLLMTVCNIPLIITGLASEHNFLMEGTLGKILCKLTTLLFCKSTVVSSMCLGVITVDRFLLFFYPQKRFITAKRVRILIGTM